MNVKCELCNSTDFHAIFSLSRTPVFLNKLFRERKEALSSPYASVNLVGCKRCGLVFNASFANRLMDYDDLYLQSQGHSHSFQTHTREVLRYIIQNINSERDRVVEIGCGKEAYFFNMLLEKGVDVFGFEPVYEGTDARIIKSYLTTETATGLQADVVVMRLVLYLLDRPIELLLNLKQLLPAHAKIFIETPRFEWIQDNGAFWDVSHEIHAYFTEEFLQGIFSGRAKIIRTFCDQYMLVNANLSDLTTAVTEDRSRQGFKEKCDFNIPNYKSALQQHKLNYVWGAGAKGCAFANLLDPENKYIMGVIDINEKKQGRFLALTGHPCISPQEVPWSALGKDSCLWIMNENYKQEILASIPNYRTGKVIVVGGDASLRLDAT